MRILKVHFIKFDARIHKYAWYWIGCIRRLSLVVFHNIDFKTATIAIILAPEFYNAIKDLGQAFHTGKQSEGASDVVLNF